MYNSPECILKLLYCLTHIARLTKKLNNKDVYLSIIKSFSHLLKTKKKR